MNDLVINIPSLGVRIAEKGNAATIKAKFKLSDEDYESMANAELASRLAGAVKRAVESGKLPKTATKAEVAAFIAKWDGLGGRKGTPLTRYNSALKSDKNVSEEEMNDLIDEAAEYLVSQKREKASA